jgi:hypothetical protein
VTVNSIRVASVCFVVSLLLTPVPARAQGPPSGGGGSLNLTAINERLATLEAAVATLQTNLAAETANRLTGDTLLQGADTALQGADTALDGRVDKLESGQIDESDLIGTYAAVILQLGLSTHTVSGVTVQHQTASGTFTLSGNPTPCADQEATTPCYSAVISGSDAFCHVFPVPPASALGWRTICSQPEVFANAPAEWRVDTDGSLVVQVGGEDVINDPNFIGAGGRVIISAGTGGQNGGPGSVPLQNGEGHSVFMVLTRMPNP